KEIMTGGAAEKAGLKVNDRVLSVDGKNVDDLETLMGLLGQTRPGDTVTGRVRRGEEGMDIKAKLDRRAGSLSARFQDLVGSKLSDRRGGFPTILQHDTVLRPEDCGGPLVNLDGKVLGINIARAGRVESYAIPSEAVRTVLDDLKSGRLAPK